MKTIFICSPYRNNVSDNTQYALSLCHKVSLLGHAPFAPHLFCTRFLDDGIETERNLGINIGLEWLLRSDEIWICSKEITPGMEKEIEFAKIHNITIRYYEELKEKELI